MKKTIMTLLILLLCCTAYATDKDKYQYTKSITWYDASTSAEVTSISASGAAYSQAFDMYNMTGYMSLHLVLTGSGTATVKYYMSNTGSDYVEPESATDLLTTKTSGTYFSQSKNPIGLWMKLYIEETGGSSSITPVGTVTIQ